MDGLLAWGSGPWAVAVLLLTVALAVELPSFSNLGWNLAPSVLLGFLILTQTKGPDVVSAAATLLVASLTAVFLVRRRITRQGVLGTLGTSTVIVIGWAVLQKAGQVVVDPTVDVRSVLSLIALIGAWLVAEGLIRARETSRFRPPNVSTSLLLADASIGTIASGSIAASAVLWLHSGPWAAGVALFPYLVTHRLVARLVVAHRIQELAIRAIGRLPEAAGVAEGNHSVAVERLAIHLGQLAGIRGQSLSDLRSAALLHDVGLVCAMAEGVRESGYSGGDVARWGAEIIGSSPPLAEAARLISGQAEPFRIPGGGPDPALDVRSQIISLACELDRLRASGIAIEEAIDVVYSESAFRFTPEILRFVVAAVRRADESPQFESGAL